ncbi:MAG: hypothetical protein FJ214_01025 [Ignavibacteria bacterium]|nr:hypothetical protein [Ignavibacteria bacterium]
MIAEDLTALEALGIAIRSEMDAQDVYKDLAELCENEELKGRFLNMYQEERRHQVLLENMYREMFPNVDIKLPPSQLPKEVNNKSARKKLGIKDVLKHAIDEEKKAREFYLDCVSSVKDLSGQRMFRFLADMEFSHQMILNAELEMIEKYPLYFENPKGWEVESRLRAGR